MSTQDNANMMQTHYGAYNDRDFDRGSALAAEDLNLTQVPFDGVHQGPEGLRQFTSLGKRIPGLQGGTRKRRRR